MQECCIQFIFNKFSQIRRNNTLIVETFVRETFASQKTRKDIEINFRELESQKIYAR